MRERKNRHRRPLDCPQGVIVLLVVAALTVSLGFARLPDSLLGIGVVGVGVFLAISARICQAREQHQALCKALEGLRRG
ncbi:hypothetical protein QE447_001155 [Stenotrophomonas sp. SORGH_AS282]|nr:hypothetical protein [Stenotrophomonas sp. SORGH_AS_0282]